MAKVIVIEVTEEHIKKGVPGDQTCCPIALAMRDLGFLVNVEYTRLRYYQPNQKQGYGREAKVSAAICDWQNFFDNNECVEPIELNLIERYDGYNMYTENELVLAS